jgi:quercetin dioxygenase-like cupin family protein
MIPNDIPATYRISRALAVAASAATLIAATAGLACDHQAQRRVASATAPSGPVKLLTARFEARSVRKIEVGDFHFTAAQVAPVHTHAAPALGYVSKGSIVYQVEGQPVQLLKAGDAFYEPAGPRILHFDNGSTTEEAVFTDFNFERAGEPFIVFPTPPVNLKLDRRSFPTVDVQGGPDVRAIDIFAETIGPGASIERPARPVPVMGYVAEGAVELRGAESSRSADAGHSFDLPAGSDKVTVINRSPSAQAKIVTFEPRP